MYIITFIILSLLSLVYLKAAEKWNIIDKPNQRSSHTIPTIRGGGILFVFAFLLYQIAIGTHELYLLMAVVSIAVISFIDDMVTLSSKLRFPFQILAVTLVIYQIGLFNLPLWIPLCTIIACTGYVNYYNFMDGINGITGFYSFAVLFGIYVVNYQNPVINNDLIIYEALALVVFGYYNFRKKARFFAGDIGSISMAVIVVYMIISLIYHKESPIYILLGVVYGADAMITMFYRFLIKEKLTEAHRHHIYQKLVDRTTLSHLQVAFLYALLQLLLVGVVYGVLFLSLPVQYITTAIVMLALVLLYYTLFNFLEKRK